MPQTTTLVLIGFFLLLLGSLGGGYETLANLAREGYLQVYSHFGLVGATLCTCAAGRVALGINFRWLLCYTSIPLGLIWSIQEFMTTLMNLQDVDALPYHVPNIMLPVFISGLFCVLAYFSMAEGEESNVNSDPRTSSVIRCTGYRQSLARRARRSRYQRCSAALHFAVFQTLM